MQQRPPSPLPPNPMPPPCASPGSAFQGVTPAQVGARMALATVSHHSHHEVAGQVHLHRSPAAGAQRRLFFPSQGASVVGLRHLSFFRTVVPV